ncbi:MAG: ComEC/Rec2 family competence protein [bacterium]
MVFILFVFCLVCSFLAFYILTKEKVYKLTFFLTLFFVLGFIRADFSTLQKSQFENLSQRYVNLYGVVSIPPKVTDKGMRMTVEVTKMGSSTLSRPENVLVAYEGYEAFKYGDRIKIGGSLEKPQPFENDTGYVFNYPKYLEKDGIFFVMQKARVEKQGEGGGNMFMGFLFDVKNSFISKMQTVLSAPDTALMSGILLGAQDSIPKNTKDDFQKSGLTHILVLSGYNITIVGVAVSWVFLLWFSKFVSLGFGTFAIILFALLSGGGASTVRATVMALIAMLGKILGRENDAIRVLFIVGFLMIFINPLTIMYDPSFHLSFLATLGMILFSKKVELKTMFIKNAKLREIFATTIATQLLVAPYFLWSMGKVSIISLISNIFVLPIIPFTMLLGFITGTLGYISFYLAYIPGFIGHLFLLYITTSAHLFSIIPFAVLSI